MRIYLVRHAEAAAPHGETEPVLTANGLRQAQSAAESAVRAGVRVERIVHSGKRRAEQTAEILARSLAPRAGVSKMEGLSPNDDVFAVARFIEDQELPLILVSHLPMLDRLVAVLVAGDPEQTLVGFTTAQMVCLEGEEGEWRIV